MSVFNLLKKYPDLLDLINIDERERSQDLVLIYKRDIEDNPELSFRSRIIYPIKSDGEVEMGRLFKHLTSEEIILEDVKGKPYPKRIFDMNRSQRLHWIKHHLNEITPENIDVFTVIERDNKKRKVRKTYIYDKVEEYIIVLEQQRTDAFYLLTAYYLNREYGKKMIEKKMKKRLPTPL